MPPSGSNTQLSVLVQKMAMLGVRRNCEHRPKHNASCTTMQTVAAKCQDIVDMHEALSTRTVSMVGAFHATGLTLNDERALYEHDPIHTCFQTGVRLATCHHNCDISPCPVLDAAAPTGIPLSSMQLHAHPNLLVVCHGIMFRRKRIPTPITLGLHRTHAHTIVARQPLWPSHQTCIGSNRGANQFALPPATGTGPAFRA
jgi:hypothetical protein